VYGYSLPRWQYLDGQGIMRGQSASGRARRSEGIAPPTVSAITVTYHTGPVLWACIDSMLAQRELRELIVVINGADEDVRARLTRRAKEDGRICLVDPGRNIGFAPGCNVGAAAARGEHLAFINPDCSLPAGTFAAVLEVLAQQPKACLVGGRLQSPGGQEQRGGRREFMTPWRAFVEATRLDRLFPNHPYFKRLHLVDETPLLEPARVPVVSGAFMMLRKSDFERLGGMDSKYFLHVDDYDLCLRIHLAGGEVWYAGNVPITHFRSTSSTSPLFVEWHKTRGACYYFKKHFRAAYPNWTLSIFSAALWARFFLLAVYGLPSHLRSQTVQSTDIDFESSATKPSSS
jgi:N-acetylglucosaminyl-diphospho-decaprenol L-rhamnosyltransferase